MPTIDPAQLEAKATRIFTAMGAPAGDAAWIAALLVRANLRGHDSHGVIRIPQYWESVKKRRSIRESPVTVTAETPALVRLDGGGGFGQVVGRRAMEMAIAKAKAGGLSAASTSRTSHVGRLADYAEMAARRRPGGHALGQLRARAQRGAVGRRRAAPRHEPARGRHPGRRRPRDGARLRHQRGGRGQAAREAQPQAAGPARLVRDAEGRPQTDPEIFYGTPPGALLTSGEHKGYGLSLAVEILGGILSGTGPAGPPPGVFANGTLMICLDVERFLPLPEFHRQVASLFGWVKSAPLAQGATEILIPGEPEARLEAERRRQGIPIEDQTWSQIETTAAELGV